MYKLVVVKGSSDRALSSLARGMAFECAESAWVSSETQWCKATEKNGRCVHKKKR